MRTIIAEPSGGQWTTIIENSTGFTRTSLNTAEDGVHVKVWHNGTLLSALIIKHSKLCSECLSRFDEFNNKEFDYVGS